MRIVHAVWSGGRLHLWCEVSPKDAQHAATAGEEIPHHPFAASIDALGDSLSPFVETSSTDKLTIRVPSSNGRPCPSPHMAHAAGLPAQVSDASIQPWRVPTVAVSPRHALTALERIDDAVSIGAKYSRTLFLSESASFYLLCAQAARRFVIEQRFVPNVLEDRSGGIRGAWRPWLGGDGSARLLADLLQAMPAAARAAADEFNHDGLQIVQDYLAAVTDALCRDVLVEESFGDAIDGRDPGEDMHVAWLGGLLGEAPDLDAGGDTRSAVVRNVRDWLSRLDERGADSEWLLRFELIEPDMDDAEEAFGAPGKHVRWALEFELQSAEHPETTIDAQSVWEGPADATTVGGLHMESPHDLLLGELARAARLYPLIERAIEQDDQPSSLSLTTTQAYDFLREIRPLLVDQGFIVQSPAWWEAPASRLGVTLELSSEDESVDATWDGATSASDRARLGLDALVDYQWRLSLGDTPLSTNEFDELTELNMPLVRISGKWVELRPEDVKAARRFLNENPGGSTTLGSALRLAFGVDAEEAGLHLRGVRADGWARRLFDPDAEGARFRAMTQPEGLLGQLRPYQLNGLSWLAFLDELRLGACLADDMGLGKTVQLLALVQAERERLGPDESVGPTLVVAPLSVIANWRREANRFTPDLRVMIHHGPERLADDAFVERAESVNIVITTFALANRDVDTLSRVHWRRVVLDEAQNVKNPTAKQTKAIMRLPASRRIALTGTPVENRLSELWSIMNFCNEGYLGSLGEFRRRFAAPIERRHNRSRAEQLRSLTRPFILRRLKSDPAVAADLPEKIENKVYSHLTPEQAALYEDAVNGMLGEVDRAEGMRRRGIVLATLIKLKQICNHPAQALGESIEGPNALAPRRSGKTLRLIEMLEEVLAEDQQALVFTQFRQMGKLLASMLRKSLDRDVLFLHGGTSQSERQRMIDQFQSADGTAPIFLLSLKAGGFGLNLTAASHVFHFDRWWNPAVENQATDRAHRIGQTRTVHVHKFIVAGTLEERIDQMIEEKSDLADRIIGSGERGLTELSTDRLRDLLTLRSDAVEDEPLEAEPALVEG